MKQTFSIVLMLLVFSICQGQKPKENFKASKGKWSFPLCEFQSADTLVYDCSGFITNSLDLVLNSNCPLDVRAIQSGKILAVFIPGGNYTLMVQSGDYYLIYAGLAKPILKRGDTIIAKGTIIGRLSSQNNDGTYGLLLRLMKKDKIANINRWFNWQNVKNSALMNENV